VVEVARAVHGVEVVMVVLEEQEEEEEEVVMAVLLAEVTGLAVAEVPAVEMQKEGHL
jgi:hypothetical protein